MAKVTLHYWAGARAAAGVETEHFEAETVTGALEQARSARSDPRFDQVLKVSSLLSGGVALHIQDLERVLGEDLTVEVLPPFAGG